MRDGQLGSALDDSELGGVTVSLAGFGGNVNLDLVPNLYQL